MLKIYFYSFEFIIVHLLFVNAFLIKRFIFFALAEVFYWASVVSLTFTFG